MRGLGRSSRVKADSTCSHSVLSALMILLLSCLEAEEPVFTVYLGSPLARTRRKEGGEAGLATLYRHAQRPPASCVSMIQSANVIKREREEKQKGEISRENRERERGGAFSDDDSERRGEGCVEWSAT